MAKMTQKAAKVKTRTAENPAADDTAGLVCRWAMDARMYVLKLANDVFLLRTEAREGGTTVAEDLDERALSELETHLEECAVEFLNAVRSVHPAVVLPPAPLPPEIGTPVRIRRR